MNKKTLMIIAAMVIVMASIVIFLFFRELMKETAVTPAAPKPEEIIEETPPSGYSIPPNSIPDVSIMEANLKKTKERHEAEDLATANARAESLASRAQAMEEALKTEAVTEAAGEVLPESVVSKQRPVKIPTKEERKKTEAHGVIAY